MGISLFCRPSIIFLYRDFILFLCLDKKCYANQNFIAKSDPVPARKCAKRHVKQMLNLENTETKYISLIVSGHQNWK
jgi:hypothetical protein